MNTCFNCGTRYIMDGLGIYPEWSDRVYASKLEGFCSEKCKQEDDARLVEGNGIIAKSELQLSDLNKLKLEHQGNITPSLNTMIQFNRGKNEEL